MKPIEIDIDRDLFVPAYWYLLGDGPADINLLWGGRDSGKSYFIAQRLVMDCLTMDYFRCLLIRKTGNSIKESQWQTIKDVCDAWGVSHFFEFKVSPLEIVCVNGNRFLARGCDEPTKLKSLRDYNRAWLEEGNQLDLTDYTLILTTLRSNTGDIQVWLSFNPETADVDYTDFWLYKVFFEPLADAGIEYYNRHIRQVVNFKVGNKTVNYTFTSTHTTYHDNLDHVSEQRVAFHESLEQINPKHHLNYTKGIWATVKAGEAWAYAYSKEKHAGRPELDRRHIVYLSFDFNRNPICCSVIQYIGGKVKVIQTIKLSTSDIYKLCDYIKLHYPGCVFMVTGDASGRGSTALVKDGINYYTVIKTQLNITDSQIKVPAVNPSLEENQTLVNAVLSFVDVEIHEQLAAGLHFDLAQVRALPDGRIDKGDRNDPTKQADALDTFRYWCNMFMQWVLKLPGKVA